MMLYTNAAPPIPGQLPQGQIVRLNYQSSMQIARQKNLVVHSQLRTYDQSNVRSSGLSLKTVLSGKERYCMQNSHHLLAENEFLMVDEGQVFDVSIQEKVTTEGLCYYLDKNYLRQAFHLLAKGEEYVLDNPFDLHNPEFSTVKHKLNGSGFGHYLAILSRRISTDPSARLEEGFFVDLALRMAEFLQEVSGIVAQIPAAKHSTKIQLYQRALMARDYIEDQLLTTKVNLKQVASASALSEVQLYRVFKKVFNTTPYQYALSRRMEIAIPLIRSEQHTIAEIGQFLCFPDTASFSKLFKKTYGASPTHFRKKRIASDHDSPSITP